MAKLPNDGSADPLSVVYDVDLTIPADKVVRLNLMLMVMMLMMITMLYGQKGFMFLFSQAGLSHTATDVVNSTLGVFNNIIIII